MMWDVDVVLTHIGALGFHSNLSDKQLTFKETMLLAFASTGRSFELKALDLRYMVMTDSNAVFELGRSTKSRSKGQKPLKLTFNVDRTIRWCCSLGQSQLYILLIKVTGHSFYIPAQKNVLRVQKFVKFFQSNFYQIKIYEIKIYKIFCELFLKNQYRANYIPLQCF